MNALRLADELRAASENPPPPHFDLDRLIATEQRHGRVVRWSVASAAVAAGVAAAVAVPLIATGSWPDRSGDPVLGGLVTCRTAGAPGPQQSHARPRPTEKCAEANVRLAAALADALDRVAPGAWPEVEFAYVPKRLRYEAHVVVPAALGGGRLQVELIASHEHPTAREAGCGTGCRYSVDAYDTIVVASVDDEPGRHQVSAYRTDGTAVRVLAHGATGLSADEIDAIAVARELTLFPSGGAGLAPVPTPYQPAAQDVTAQALTTALAKQLSGLLGTARLVDPNAPAGAPAPWFTGSRESGYKAAVEIRDADGTGYLSVNVMAQRPECTTQPHCETGPRCPFVDVDSRCDIAPNGTKVYVLGVNDEGRHNNQVELHRTDGSIVQLVASNWKPNPASDPTTKPTAPGPGWPPALITRPAVPLTLDRLVEIGNALRL